MLSKSLDLSPLGMLKPKEDWKLSTWTLEDEYYQKGPE